nr:uncharacterized protein LOC123763609 [Procambarus clarkii]
MDLQTEHTRLNMEDYRILHQLGLGSYGSAHLALHIPSDTKCVIKEINISHMSPKEIEEARREVKVLSSLSHPYITQFRASCEEDGRLMIAMDYCGGGDLHTIISSRKGVLFPEDRILDWFVQLCLAVKYIHDRKILHRDIKSQNIFLTDDGKIRLGDFGIAKVLNSTSDLARTCIGTPYYLSPEMCENKPYNNKSDIWALGCVLYEMITLKHAFEANNMKALILKIVKGIYQPVSTRYSRDLRLLLGQIFQREPQVRPSISVILRKTFILKKVPRFISGCEEEELMASLMKRKCALPASARNVPVMKRPSDITDPSVKYGVSQSFSKRVTQRSPTKCTSKVYKQAVSGKKSSGVPYVRAPKLTQEHRKKFQSENSLLVKDKVKAKPQENNDGRSQRRSKSVPLPLKQSNSKPQNHYVKKKAPSPVKLKLMLDRAGIKKNGLYQNKIEIDKKACNLKNHESNNSPGAEGWLVDEFLSKKLQAAYNDRKLAEALLPPDTSESESATFDSGIPTRFKSVAKVDEKENKIQNDMCWVSRDLCACKLSKLSRKMENKDVLHLHNDQSQVDQFLDNISPDEQLQEKNRKDVKELANKTLKQHGVNGSDDDDDDDLPVLPAEKVRALIHEKIKKLLQERSEKMNQMVLERRQWAYQREKLESTTAKDEEGLEFLGNMIKCNVNYNIGGEQDLELNKGSISSKFPDESKIHLAGSKSIVETVYSTCANVSTTSANESPLNVLMNKTEYRGPDDEICSAGSTKPKHQIRECIMPPDFRERCVEQIPNEMLSNAVEEWVKVGNLSGNLAQNQSKQHNQITLKSNSLINGLIETIDEMTFEKKYQFSQLNVCKCKPESSDVDLYEITSKGSVTSSPNISELSTNVTSIDINEGTTDKHSTGTSYSLPNSHCVTPTKRSHWGSAITSGLENSPLESTGSKMESTSSSDLVVVYKEVGERKQWIKNCKDIINVLSEAKIIESPVFQKTVKKCECEVDAKEALNNEMGISNSKCSVNPNKSAVLNSTFTVTLKECVGDCKDYKSNCISDSFPNAIIISNKTSSVENNHLIKTPSSLNITFEIGNQEACNNNHKMPNYTNEELCRPNFVETACSGAQISDMSCVENIDLDKTLILEVGNEERPNTNNYTVENKDNRAGNQLSTTLTGEKIQSMEAIETIPPSADDTVKPLDETFTVEDNMADITYIIPSEPSNNSHKKAKGGLLGMLRLHMSPRPKKKYVIADGVSRSGEDKLKRKMSDSLLGITKVWNTPVTKQKKSKCGLTGMLQKLPCRQDVNLESTEAVEKGTLEITEICEKSTGDSESKENCSVVLDTKKFGIKEYSKTNSSMKNYKPDLASSEPTNRVRENNEMSRKLDKDNLLLHETTGSEGFVEVLKRERLVLKEFPGIDQGNDTDDKLRTKDDQSFEGTQISVIIQDNDSLVPVIEEKVEPGFDFVQTNVQGTELCTSIANSNNNDLNNAEINLSIINSKTDAPSICLNNVSSDSGLGTQTTDFTCITADNEASDVESVLNYSLEKCDQTSPCQTQSSEINNLADYASSGVDEEIYSEVMMKKAPKMQFFEKGISLPALKANKISMTTDDYSNEMEDSIHCAKDIAHTILLDVFERAREQVSVNDTRERYRDISPITPRSIHINMNCSGEIKDQNLNQHENEDLLYHSKLCTSSLGTLQSKECKNDEVDMQKIDDTLPNWKMKNNRRIDYEGSIVTSSPARPRPTRLCIGSNNNANLIADLMYLSSLQTLECEETEESYVESFFKSQEDESKPTLRENYMLSEGSTSVPVPQNSMQHQCSQSNINVQSKDLPEISDAHLGARAKTCILTDDCNKDNNNSASDEESEDFANLRQSMELLLGSREQRRESDCKSIISLWTGASSELWHLDDDGGVVSGGGGGVYGWIEEQRAKLEDILGLELFMRAYHHLEEAQEREGCVVGEAVTRVEEMLGRENCHMAYDILQLVVSEAVYHN